MSKPRRGRGGRHHYGIHSPQVSSQWTPMLGLKTHMPELSLDDKPEQPVASGTETVLNLKKLKAHRPFVIGVCGGTASGKTSVCNLLAEALGNELSQVPSDVFYKSLSPEQKEQAMNCEYDFDHPQSIDFEGFVEAMRDLRMWRDVKIPQYCFTTHSRLPSTTDVKCREIVMVEGILIFNDPRIRDLCDLKIFVECDADIRLARRIRRDISERGRSLHGVIEQYNKFVKPSYHTFVEPSKRFADVIIPNIGESLNTVAVDLISQHIKIQLQVREEQRGRLQSKDAPRSGNRRCSSTGRAEPSTPLMSGRQGLLVSHRVGRLGLPRSSHESSPREQESPFFVKSSPSPSDSQDAAPSGSSDTPESDGNGKGEGQQRVLGLVPMNAPLGTSSF